MWPMPILSTKHRYIQKMRIIYTERGYIQKMLIISKYIVLIYPQNADNIHGTWIFPWNADISTVISMTRIKYLNITHSFTMQIYSLYGNQHHQKPTPQPQRVLPTMSTPNTKVAEMTAHLNVSSGSHHGDPTIVITNVMIAWVSGNMSSRNRYLADNVISSHSNPTNSTSTSGKLKTVYVGKNRYPITIIQLYEVSEIT